MKRVRIGAKHKHNSQHQFHLDGPPLDLTRSTLRQILERKSLSAAAFDVASAARCLTEVPTIGLCFASTATDTESQVKFINWTYGPLEDHLVTWHSP